MEDNKEQLFELQKEVMVAQQQLKAVQQSMSIAGSTLLKTDLTTKEI